MNSPHKGQWRGALMFSLFCACIKVWVNNRNPGDLRRHRAHYDVIVSELRPLAECSQIIHWTFKNQLDLSLNQNIHIQEIAFENVVCKVSAILFRPQYVNWSHEPLCRHPKIADISHKTPSIQYSDHLSYILFPGAPFTNIKCRWNCLSIPKLQRLNK